VTSPGRGIHVVTRFEIREDPLQDRRNVIFSQKKHLLHANDIGIRAFEKVHDGINGGVKGWMIVRGVHSSLTEVSDIIGHDLHRILVFFLSSGGKLKIAANEYESGKEGEKRNPTGAGFPPERPDQQEEIQQRERDEEEAEQTHEPGG
jgi:hypothetical protein